MEAKLGGGGRQPSGVVPDSRSSSVVSVSTEPLTLDGEELQDAKAAAEDVLRNYDPQTAEEIFGLRRRDFALSEEQAVNALAAQINELVDKAQQVVEANEVQAEALARIPGTAAAEAAKHSDADTPNLPENGTPSLD